MNIQSNPIELNRNQAFAIRRWSQEFENAQSRRTRHLNYTVTPHQDQSFANQRVLTHPGGYKALAIWHLILQCAARCPQRGLLVDASGPLGFGELAHQVNISETDIREALAILCDPKVKWVEIVECPRNLVVSGSLRAGRKGRPRRPDVIEVESQSSGPVFYIEKCFTATVNIEGEEPTFDAEQILPAEFEALVVIAQKAEAAKDAGPGVLEHISGTPAEQPKAPEKGAPPEPQTAKAEKKPKAKVPDLSHLDFKSAIEVLERTPHGRYSWLRERTQPRRESPIQTRDRPIQGEALEMIVVGIRPLQKPILEKEISSSTFGGRHLCL